MPAPQWSEQDMREEWKKLGIGASRNMTELNMKPNLTWIL